MLSTYNTLAFNLLAILAVLWCCRDSRYARQQTQEYAEIIDALFAADEPCSSPICRTTVMGHLIGNTPPKIEARIRQLDPTT